MYLRGNLRIRRPFGHPTQDSTLVQLVATCDFLWVRLARAIIARRPATQARAISSLCSSLSVSLHKWTVTGLPGPCGLPAQRHVMKVYSSDCVLVQIQLQQMVENLQRRIHGNKELHFEIMPRFDWLIDFWRELTDRLTNSLRTGCWQERKKNRLAPNRRSG